MNKPRQEVATEDCWNVEAMYSDMSNWEKEFQSLIDGDCKPRWPELAAYKGKLSENPQMLREGLEKMMNLERKLSKLYTYAHLRHDEDITLDHNKIAYNKILSILFDFNEETSWFLPELISLSDEQISDYMSSPELVKYQFHLDKILRMKKHTLTHEKEELMALAGKAIQTPNQAFSAINNADFCFGKVKDAEGREHELTHASFGLHLREHDRVLRKNSFDQMHGKFKQYENTLCELLQGNVQGHLFDARARKYDSCLHAALYRHNIDTEVYHALIKAVNENLGILHKYIRLREKVMGVKPLHLYDMYVPLIEEVDIRMDYQEAEEITIESVAPLGSEYQNLLRKGLKDERWVDRYENLHKRSGAYSSGCYDSPPYILMNYKGVFRDVSTLAHEAGHSMHSLLSHKHQPYHYGDYPIFLAEVASTFNEDLLLRLMLERAQTKQEKIYLLNSKIDDIRSTLFRQTMFAEFELQIHTMAENNIPLTPHTLNEAFKKLNQKYFGETVVVDEVATVEWARIPHFYYNFYVYQYATGISAALALADRVVEGGDREREEYLAFLKSGSSRFPIEILKTAGVDMRSPAPVAAAIQKFGDLVDQLEVLL